MDDTALLRQTIRRCTAVLVATLSTLGVSLQSPEEASYLLMLAIVSMVYLAVEFIKVSPPAENPGNPSSTDGEK
ncbi:hypothetical protein [Haloarcula amylolytica]|uniref:Uncharacterized protein n=1 Tax=Haloarcula amylolytica JCM 13557 TaxID=1227452 RepID=M0KJQ4_9EURY|nr:hypothetical protein [Haloarcula amylolytica]EMA21386.1 hypothetical protein C442_10126 [Haloarcula amylolytica JCM 13557]